MYMMHAIYSNCGLVHVPEDICLVASGIGDVHVSCEHAVTSAILIELVLQRQHKHVLLQRRDESNNIKFSQQEL